MPFTITPSATSFPVGNVPAGKGLATPIPFTIECPAGTQLNIVLGPLVNATFEVLGWRYTGLSGPVYVAGSILNLDASLGLDVTLFVRAKTDLLIVPPLPFSTTFDIHGVAGLAIADSGNLVVSGTVVAADVNRAAIDLVLDRSHFMDTTTTARAKAACGRLIDFMSDADWLGVATYTTAVTHKLSVRELTPDNRNTAKLMIAGVKPTTLESSLFQAVDFVSNYLSELPGACVCTPDSRAMMLLSMGQETLGAPLPALGAARRFAIALGPTPGLLPSVTSDYFVLGNTADPNEMFRLDKFLLQSLAQMSGLAVILDPSGTLDGAREVSVPFDVADTDSNVRVLLLVDEPEHVQLELKVGDQHIPPHEFPGASLLRGSGSLEFSLDRTVLEQTHPDEEGCKPHHKKWRPEPKGQALPAPLPSKTWNAVLSLSKAALARGTRLRPVPWTLIVFAESDLHFTASAHLDNDYIGGLAYLSAWLSEHGSPVTGERVRVLAEVSYPDGGTGTIRLTETVAGRFEATVRCTIPGAYRYRILAAGTTFRKKPFKRELTRTTFTRSRTSHECGPCVTHQACAPHGKHPHHAPKSSEDDEDDDEMEG